VCTRYSRGQIIWAQCVHDTGDPRCLQVLHFFKNLANGKVTITTQNILATHRLHYSGQSEPPRSPAILATNSRLTILRGKLLRDYADRHSCLIHETDSPTTVPYNPSASPDVLDIAVTENLPTPVYLTACSALSSDHLPVLIDTRCRSSFLNLLDRPDFRRTDWSKFHACLDNNIPFNSETADEASIDTCVENLTNAISGALELSTPKSRPRADPRPPIPARIRDEIRLKNRLRRRWQLTRDPALKAEVNRLQRSVTLQLQEWRNDQWSDTLGALHPEDQSLWRMTKMVMRVTTPTPRWELLSGLRESRGLSRQSWGSVSAGSRPIGPGSYWDGWCGFASVLLWARKRTHVDRLRGGSWCLPGSQYQQGTRPDGIPNRALKHLLVALFNAILRTQYFPPVWKHARVISILKPGNDLALPSSYRPISLLDTIGKVF
jgi:hypothetical protein